MGNTLGQLVGSDAQEAFEALVRVPLWCILALSSLQEQRPSLWYARYGAFFAWFTLMALAAGRSLERDETARRQLVDEREQIGL